jgi:DNA polymerase-3 subunit epsilon
MLYFTFTLRGKVEFVVMDFETASLSRTSAVEVGLVRFVDGQPREQYTTLINPPKGEKFHPDAVKLHGITASTVKQSPNFPLIYEDLLDFIGDAVVVGHNVQFDLEVLFSSAAYYGLPKPKLKNRLCTKSLSQKHLSIEPNTLGASCEFFSIKNPQAHRAISDCVATGFLAIAIAEYVGKDLSQFVKRISQAERTKLSMLIQAAPKRRMPEKALRKGEAREISMSLGADSEDKPLRGLEVILSGTFQNFGKQEGQMLVLTAGGTTGDNLSKKTAYLVSSDLTSTNNKHKKALELQSKGSGIKIISESQFIELLGPIWPEFKK